MHYIIQNIKKDLSQNNNKKKNTILFYPILPTSTVCSCHVTYAF